MTIASIGDYVKTHMRFANGKISVVDVLWDQQNDGARLHLTVGEASFLTQIDYRLLRVGMNERAVIDALCAPMLALEGLWKDGIAEGRKRERDDELRQVREKCEDAYRRMRYGVLAAAYRAVVSTLGKENAA